MLFFMTSSPFFSGLLLSVFQGLSLNFLLSAQYTKISRWHSYFWAVLYDVQVMHVQGHGPRWKEGERWRAENYLRNYLLLLVPLKLKLLLNENLHYNMESILTLVLPELICCFDKYNREIQILWITDRQISEPGKLMSLVKNTCRDFLS